MIQSSSTYYFEKSAITFR